MTNLLQRMELHLNIKGKLTRTYIHSYLQKLYKYAQNSFIIFILHL